MMASTHPVRSLADLPTEILMKIVLALDGYSISNLIDAYPEISPYFLLMTHDRPHVFTSQHLRCYRKSSTSYKNYNFKQYLKLYEYGYKYNPFWDPVENEEALDGLSFVHMRTLDHSHIQPLVKKYPLTTFESSPVCFGQDFKVFSCQEYLKIENQKTRKTGHKRLILKDVTTELNGFSHPSLHSLTIVFTSNHLNPPELKNLRLPKLHSLRLVYFDLFPSLDNIWVSPGDKTGPRGIIQLIHAPSMRFHLDRPLHSMQPVLDPQTRYTLGDASQSTTHLRTTRRGTKVHPLPYYFDRIFITGGPICLGELLTSARRDHSFTDHNESMQTGLSCLYWKQTVSDLSNEQLPISLAQVFDVEPHANSLCPREITYECTFMNPIPFVNDIKPSARIKEKPGYVRSWFVPFSGSVYNINVIYHTTSNDSRSTSGPVDIEESTAILYDFSHRLEEYIDGFLKNGTAGDLRVNFLTQEPLQEDISASQRPITIRLTDAYFREICWQALVHKRSTSIDLIGYLRLHDASEDQKFNQIVMTGSWGDWRLGECPLRSHIVSLIEELEPFLRPA